MEEIILGDEVKDSITGLTGTATAQCSYLNGCDHIAIQPPAKDGRIPPAQWVDLPQVVLVKARATPPNRLKGRHTGGPSIHPPSDNEDDDWAERADDMHRGP